jgi:hypothetical protein
VSGVDGELLDLVPALSLEEAARRIDFMLAKAAHERVANGCNQQ